MNWILIDTADVVVHVLYRPLREFYDLEGLYFDSPKIGLPINENINEQNVLSNKTV